MPQSNSPKKRKPRTSTKPYVRKDPSQRKRKDPNAPKSSAVLPPKHGRTHLTLADWLMVVDYADKNPHLTQQEVVQHFKTRPEGMLFFSHAAPSLSRHLSVDGRAEDQAKAVSTPNALSGKRARIVTRPDVEDALYLWTRSLELRGETVTGAMLVEKRRLFEERMNVPTDERLRGTGGVAGFLKAYVSQGPIGVNVAELLSHQVQYERIPSAWRGRLCCDRSR